ncbi:MAG TPA: MoaD/ThiS family protein [Chloroflexota bacterium]|nr:MoaD/ThiS family protein [Chloroflexota bacterium]
MRIVVYPPYRNAIGNDVIELPLTEGISLRDLLCKLGERYPPFGELARARDDEFLWGQLTVHVNEQLAGLATVLQPDDRIDLMPPLAGG